MTDGLLQISGCKNADRVADVVFVHGLDGDAESTWHTGNDKQTSWPHWLGEDYPQLGIWSLGYAASSLAWRGHTMPLYDRATATLEILDLDRIGQRPVVFICHSLGGLLIKQALRIAKDAPNRDWQAIIEQTRQLVFLSTPHSGSDMASWLKYIGGLLQTTVSVEELEAHHPRLRELNTWYRDHVAGLNINTYVFFEKRKTKKILVVNETSADPGIPGVRPIPLDEDHISICKPVDRKAIVYRRITRLLEPLLNETKDEEPSDGLLYSGPVKVQICRRLGNDWHTLADYFEISNGDRGQFQQGLEPQAVWNWLDQHGKLQRLAEGLDSIGRSDLVEVLENPQ